MEDSFGGEDRKQQSMEGWTTSSTNNEPEPELPGTEEINTSTVQIPVKQRPLWIDLMAIIGVFIVASLVGGIIGGLILKTAGAEKAFATFIANAIALTITIAFALWIKSKRSIQGPLLSFSLKKTSPTIVLWGLILVLITSFILEPLLDLFPEVNMDLIKSTIGTGGWAMMSAIVLAPVLEEILFRGIIQDAVTAEYGKLKGLLVASAIFGIVHIIPQQAINAFFVGIILGYIYIKTRSLVPVIIIHAINNALAYIIMVWYEDRAYVSVSDVITNPVWYWITYGLCAVIFVIAAVNIWQQLNKKPVVE